MVMFSNSKKIISKDRIIWLSRKNNYKKIQKYIKYKNFINRINKMKKTNNKNRNKKK